MSRRDSEKSSATSEALELATDFSQGRKRNLNHNNCFSRNVVLLQRLLAIASRWIANSKKLDAQCRVQAAVPKAIPAYPP